MQALLQPLARCGCLPTDVWTDAGRGISQPRLTKQALWRVILRLRIPGTIPGVYPEYPDPLRGDDLTVVVTYVLAVPLNKHGCKDSPMTPYSMTHT